MKIALALIAIAVLPGCTFTVSPDGSRTYSANGEQIMRAIEVFAEK